MTEYLCARCGQTRPEDNFYPARRESKHRYRPVMYWCIRCCRAYKRTDERRAADRARYHRRKPRAQATHR